MREREQLRGRAWAKASDRGGGTADHSQSLPERHTRLQIRSAPPNGRPHCPPSCLNRTHLKSTTIVLIPDQRKRSYFLWLLSDPPTSIALTPPDAPSPGYLPVMVPPAIRLPKYGRTGSELKSPDFYVKGDKRRQGKVRALVVTWPRLCTRPD